MSLDPKLPRCQWPGKIESNPLMVECHDSEWGVPVHSAAIVTAGEYVECEGWWNNDRRHGLQFKTQHLRVVLPSTLEGM